MSDKRKGSGPPSIIERPLTKGKNEVSLSAFSYLFSEFVQYSQQRVTNLSELEKKLWDLGNGIGVRVLELACFREKNSRREVKLVNMLYFIHTTVWKLLFGKPADTLEKSTEHEDEYMIVEKEPLVNKFISVPKDLSNLNCAFFVAGIVAGVLNGADFDARVTAHSVPVEGQQDRTTILIKFSPEVMQREKRLNPA